MSQPFRLIKCHRAKDKALILWGKTAEGDKVCFTIEDFDPYFYVLAEDTVNDDDIVDCQWDFQSLYGDEVRKIIVKVPDDVPLLRDKFTKHFESDIPFARRFLIDKKIRAYFKVIKTEKGWDFIGDDHPDYSHA